MLTSLPTYSCHSRLLGAGEPLVIFEAGCGAPSSEFDYIARQIAKVTRVLLYDRAGCGKSSVSSRKRSAAQYASELRALLRARSLRPPFLFVGHSLGGFPARYFSLRYPREVVGLVLLDVAHERMGERLPPLYWAQETHMIQSLGGIGAAEAASMPECGQAIEFLGNHLGDLPLTVVSATNKFHDCPTDVARKTVLDAWKELQLDLAARSTNARVVVATKSGHSVHRDDPELVVREILRMLHAIRSAQS